MTATVEAPPVIAPLVRRIPWAGLVTITNDHQSTLSQPLLAAGGLDWDVAIRPLYRTLSNGDVVKCLRDREVYRVEPGNALDEYQLGSVKTRYNPLPNREIFAFGDLLVQNGHGLWHAAGQQNGGSRVLMIMKIGDEFDVMGDPHQMYIVFRSAHDGSGAIRADLVPFRLTCFNANQVSQIGGTAKATWRVIHTTNMKTRLAEAEVSLQKSIEYRDAYMGLCAKLAGIQVLPEQGHKLLEKAIKKNRTRRDDVIGDIEHNWLTSSTIPDAARLTGWGFLNGVTEYFGHICDRRGSGNSLYESIMTGEGAKAREIIVKLLAS